MDDPPSLFRSGFKKMDMVEKPFVPCRFGHPQGCRAGHVKRYV